MYRMLALIGLACMTVPAQAESSPESIAYISCRTCHADPGSDSAIPAIAGRPAAELSEALTQMNPADSIIMHRFTSALSAEEIDALATYISGLKGDAQ
jgi:cytochrome c553